MREGIGDHVRHDLLFFVSILHFSMDTVAQGSTTYTQKGLIVSCRTLPGNHLLARLAKLCRIDPGHFLCLLRMHDDPPLPADPLPTDRLAFSPIAVTKVFISSNLELKLLVVFSVGARRSNICMAQNKQCILA